MDWNLVLSEISPYLVSALCSALSLVVCFVRTRHSKLHEDTNTTCDLSKFYVLDKDGNKINLEESKIHREK